MLTVDRREIKYDRHHSNDRSRVAEQRLTFTISGRVGRHNSLEPKVSSGISSGRYVQRADEKDRENDKRENPLESNNLDGELLDGEGCRSQYLGI